MLRITVGESLGDLFDDLSKARKVTVSQLIREAVGTCSSTVEPSTIAYRNATQRGHLRAITIKLGPRMAEAIRAQRLQLQTTASAYVEACCLVYLQSFERPAGNGQSVTAFLDAAG
jgi:hypothetical protein